MRLWILLIVGTGLLFLGNPHVASAQSFRLKQNLNRPTQTKPTMDTISPSHAKSLAVKQYGGKALSAQLYKSGTPQAYYRVKIIKGSEFKIVNIPAGR